MSTIQLQQQGQNQRPKEYLILIDELKHSISKAIDIVHKINEVGSQFGLSKQQIRNDIERALEGIVKKRQLMNLLPSELKHTKFTNNRMSKKDAIIASSVNIKFHAHISSMGVKRKRYVICIPARFDSDVAKLEGKELTIHITR